MPIAPEQARLGSRRRRAAARAGKEPGAGRTRGRGFACRPRAVVGVAVDDDASGHPRDTKNVTAARRAGRCGADEASAPHVHRAQARKDHRDKGGGEQARGAAPESATESACKSATDSACMHVAPSAPPSAKVGRWCTSISW